MQNTHLPALKKQALPRRARRGFSLVETIVATAISLLLLTVMAAALRSMSLSARQQVTDTGMGFDARRGVDEMLAQMRYAEKVIASQTVGAKTYTTSDTTIVVQAVGYDPATANIVLVGITDYIIFEYDATKKEIRETVIPGTGSKRVTRSNYRLARNVDSLVLTYRVRDQFVKPVSGPLKELSTEAVTAPTVTVNGEVATASWSLRSPKVIDVSAASGADIQAFYPVSASNTAALTFIQQVDVAVNFLDTDSRNTARTLTMAGSACLRNRRD